MIVGRRPRGLGRWTGALYEAANIIRRKQHVQTGQARSRAGCGRVGAAGHRAGAGNAGEAVRLQGHGRVARRADHSTGWEEGGGDQEDPEQDQSARGLQDQPLRHRARRPPHRGRATGRGGVRRHPQEQRLRRHRPRQGPRRRRGQAVRGVAQDGDPERRVLLQGRLPLHRRAEPGAGVSRGRVLLREPRRGRLQRRQAGRVDPARGGELQPHRPHLPDRPRQQALHHARPALQRGAQGEARSLQQGRHGRHHPHGPRRQEPRGVRTRRAQLRGARLQPQGRARCGSTTTRSTAWATTSRRAS